jgi:hypothetical protein
MQTRRWLTPAAAADRLNVYPHELAKLVREGKILAPSRRRGGHGRISEDEGKRQALACYPRRSGVQVMRWIRELFTLKEATPEEQPPDTTSRIRPPKRRGLSPAEREAEQQRYIREMRALFAATSRRERERALRLGFDRYVWRTCQDEATCPTCAKREGMTFSWKKPPPGGHPGEVTCCSMGWCRCYAATIVPRFL